jgi:DNA-binding NtrC family response regulator
LEQVNAEGAKQLSGFAAGALDRLAAYLWPGDCDELEAMVREAHAKADGPQVLLQDLPRRLELAADAAIHSHKIEETIVLAEFMASIERELIERAMEQTKGNKARASRLLGITRQRLIRRLVQLGLEPADEAEIDMTVNDTESAG